MRSTPQIWIKLCIKIIHITLNEWLLFNANSAILLLSWPEQVNFQWNDDEVRFVLDQHAELDFYSASSLKQQFGGRHVAPLWNIIMILSQPVFDLSPECMLSEEATHANFIVFGLPDRGSNPESTALEATTLTITPPMWLRYIG